MIFSQGFPSDCRRGFCRRATERAFLLGLFRSTTMSLSIEFSTSDLAEIQTAANENGAPRLASYAFLRKYEKLGVRLADSSPESVLAHARAIFATATRINPPKCHDCGRDTSKSRVPLPDTFEVLCASCWCERG